MSRSEIDADLQHIDEMLRGVDAGIVTLAKSSYLTGYIAGIKTTTEMKRRTGASHACALLAECMIIQSAEGSKH